MKNEKNKFDFKNFLSGILKKDRIVVYLRARKGVSRKEKNLEKMANKKTYKYVLHRGWLKQNSTKLLTCALGIALIITSILSYPAIKQAIIQKQINSMPVETHAPVETLTPVDKTVDGGINEYADVTEELKEAYDFLSEKLLNDARLNFEMDIDNIDNINGIYNISVANENVSKDSVVQIIINSNGKNYIFEYTALEEDFKDGFKIDNSINSTNTILSLIYDLTDCYPSNIIEQDEQKTEIASKIKTKTGENVLIGDPIIYAENAVSNIYQIPVYQKNSCTLYSIKESVLAEHSEDINFDAVMNLLSQYIDDENNLFTITSLSQINGAEDVYDAIDLINQDLDITI